MKIRLGIPQSRNMFFLGLNTSYKGITAWWSEAVCVRKSIADKHKEMKRFFVCFLGLNFVFVADSAGICEVLRQHLLDYFNLHWVAKNIYYWQSINCTTFLAFYLFFLHYSCEHLLKAKGTKGDVGLLFKILSFFTILCHKTRLIEVMSLYSSPKNRVTSAGSAAWGPSRTILDKQTYRMCVQKEFWKHCLNI